MANQRTSRNRSYTELEGVPGFVYIARNDMHGEHIYKVGGTSLLQAHLRIDTLNRTYSKGREAALGFFELHYDAETLDAGGAEKLAHESLKRYRLKNAGATEFFKAPIHDIMAAIDIAVKTVNEKQRLKQAQQQEDAIVKKESERNLENNREINAAAAILKTHDPQNHFQQPKQFTRPSTPIEIIDLKCPSCNIGLTLARPQAKNSKQLRCMGCKHLFHWSDWLEKQASDLAPAQRNDAIPVFIPQKTIEKQENDDAVRKGIVGLFAVLFALPFLIAIFSTQDKAIIAPPVASGIPATAAQQAMPMQTPIDEALQSQPITTVTEHHTKVTAKPRPNKPSKKDHIETDETKGSESISKAERDYVNAHSPTIPNAPQVIAEQSRRPDTAPIYITPPSPTDSQGCRWVSSIEWKCK
jgi:T5orf172 domain